MGQLLALETHGCRVTAYRKEHGKYPQDLEAVATVQTSAKSRQSTTMEDRVQAGNFYQERLSMKHDFIFAVDFC